tara:strand:- start:14016 stop:14624 length:609 start_codon:yes stop_codon:yes gene_type:complete
MRKILLIISVTIFTLTVKAQKKIIFGVKGGINITNMTSDYFVENNSKTGFHIGIVTEIPFGDKFSLQSEILYSTHNAEGKVILDGVPYPGAPAVPPFSEEYELNYIQVPVLAKIYLVKNLSLEIGPSFNFLIDDKEIFGSSTRTDVGKNFEFSGVLGLSYKIKGGIFGSLRYVNGFSVALDRDNYDEDAKNIGFQLGIGFMF